MDRSSCRDFERQLPSLYLLSCFLILKILFTYLERKFLLKNHSSSIKNVSSIHMYLKGPKCCVMTVEAHHSFENTFVAGLLHPRFPELLLLLLFFVQIVSYKWRMVTHLILYSKRISELKCFNVVVFF